MAQTHEGFQSLTDPATRFADPFRHEAMFYAGEQDFTRKVGDFVRDGLERGEPILVAVAHHKIEGLKEYIGADADKVAFADMDDLGRNPGRIIPVWLDFLEETRADGRPVRGVGEPISAARGPEELVEAQRHEALLNVAFGANDPLWLVCPYDTTTLTDAVLQDARRHHPLLVEDGRTRRSDIYPGLEAFAKPFDAPLPEPPVKPRTLTVAIDLLEEIRRAVEDEALALGLNEFRAADLVLCVNEIATNSILHGGGEGDLRIWRTDDLLACEIRDAGRIEDPLAGRSRPVLGGASGYGLWLANQLCDLVQMRTLPTGTVVRLSMRCR